MGFYSVRENRGFENLIFDEQLSIVYIVVAGRGQRDKTSGHFLM